MPGLEASVAWGPVDVYIEAEYVRDSHAQTDSYTYAWSELGYRPAEWLRVGIAGQRTRIYGGDRDIQRGPFAQMTVDHVTVGGYWFNPGRERSGVRRPDQHRVLAVTTAERAGRPGNRQRQPACRPAFSA